VGLRNVVHEQCAENDLLARGARALGSAFQMFSAFSAFSAFPACLAFPALLGFAPAPGAGAVVECIFPRRPVPWWLGRVP